MRAEEGERPRYHVVTYVTHTEDPRPEAEVLAEGVLENPTNAKDGVQGDHTKAVLSVVDEFVCDGSDACEGDDRTFRNAEERVIVRLNGPERIDITWRKYRPAVAAAILGTEQPFEHEHDGLRVRIEARRVVDGDGEVQPGTIADGALKAFRKDLKSMQGSTERRAQVRGALKSLEGHLDAVGDRIEALRERLDGVADGDELAAALDASRKATAEAHVAAKDAGIARLAQPQISDDDVAAVNGLLSEKAFDGCLDALTTLDEKTKVLQAIQAQIAELATRLEGVGPKAAQKKAAAYAERLAAHPKPDEVKKVTKQVEGDLTKIYKTARPELRALVKAAQTAFADRGDGLEATIEDISRRFDAAVAAVGADVSAAVKPMKDLVRDLGDGRCFGFVEITPVRTKGGRLKRWDVTFENTGDQSWIGTMSFVQSGKNSGTGLESMGLPGAGARAVQAIHADKNYGVALEPGAMLRIAIRGRSFLEVPLPGDEPVAYSVGEFERMANNDGDYYLAADAVAAKRTEKMTWTHKDDGTTKVVFYDNDRRLN